MFINMKSLISLFAVAWLVPLFTMFADSFIAASALECPPEPVCSQAFYDNYPGCLCQECVPKSCAFGSGSFFNESVCDCQACPPTLCGSSDQITGCPCQGCNQVESCETEFIWNPDVCACEDCRPIDCYDVGGYYNKSTCTCDACPGEAIDCSEEFFVNFPGCLCTQSCTNQSTNINCRLVESPAPNETCYCLACPPTTCRPGFVWNPSACRCECQSNVTCDPLYDCLSSTTSDIEACVCKACPVTFENFTATTLPITTTSNVPCEPSGVCGTGYLWNVSRCSCDKCSPITCLIQDGVFYDESTCSCQGCPPAPVCGAGGSIPGYPGCLCDVVCDYFETCEPGFYWSTQSCSCMECSPTSCEPAFFWDPSSCYCQPCPTEPPCTSSENSIPDKPGCPCIPPCIPSTCIGRAVFNTASCSCECLLTAHDCSKDEKIEIATCSCVPGHTHMKTKCISTQ